jgi:hypothetical protein
MKQLPRPLLFCLSLTLALLPIQAQTAAPPAATNREPAKPAMAPSVVQADYGKMPDGTPVEIFTLTNKNGAVAKIIGYGATIAELDVPDRDGKMGNVVLGADSLAAYQRFAQQAFVAGRGGEADLCEQRRRRRLSRHADHERDLHPDRAKYLAPGLHRHDRQAHAGEFDQPRVF